MIKIVSGIGLAVATLGLAVAEDATEVNTRPDSSVMRSPFPLISQWDIHYDNPIGTASPRSYMPHGGSGMITDSLFPAGRYTISFADTSGCGSSCIYQEVEWRINNPYSPHYTLHISSFRTLPEIILDPATAIELDESFAGEPDAFILLGNHLEYRLMRWLDRETRTFETVRPVCAPETGASLVEGQNRRLLGPWNFNSYCLVTTRDQLEAVIRTSLDENPPGSGFFIWRFVPEEG